MGYEAYQRFSRAVFEKVLGVSEHFQGFLRDVSRGLRNVSGHLTDSRRIIAFQREAYRVHQEVLRVFQRTAESFKDMGSHGCSSTSQGFEEAPGASKRSFIEFQER